MSLTGKKVATQAGKYVFYLLLSEFLNLKEAVSLQVALNSNVLPQK